MYCMSPTVARVNRLAQPVKSSSGTIVTGPPRSSITTSQVGASMMAAPSFMPTYASTAIMNGRRMIISTQSPVAASALTCFRINP